MEPIEPSASRAIIFAGGEIGTQPSPDPDAFVVAADSGWDHAVDLGHHVDLLIGDLDSISQAGLRTAESSGIAIERHPSDKDDTDFTLALAAVADRGYTRLDVYGGEGGRIGHLLGVATALTQERLRHIDITWHVATGSVHPLADGGAMDIAAPIGSIVSLITLTDCTGVSVEGVSWPLRNDILEQGTSRGLSNTTNAEQASVSLNTGAMLVIVEGNES
ncbi:MAG: thiamine diphosphokinase, partial [Armatimonadetes bacterium]